MTIINESHEDFDSYKEAQEAAHRRIDDCKGYLLITFNMDGTQTISRDTARLNQEQVDHLYGFAIESLEA